ncbi:hypothetical protein D9757_003212 [Collybiopsis confluens]|uniref:Nitrogen permease regulator 3 n=1 Tax=Collybiopsis confluens TaxID=2823264 RepID=A0A8H5HYU2_9AGAR|nr:hypothetical protein D9757_003212 [Collybiopsis confluens]
MAETLLAILLVNSSAKGSTLVYHWPPDPIVPPRLRRALPLASSKSPQYDIDPSYRWERPNPLNRDRSSSYSHAPSSGRNTPAKDLDELEDQEIRDGDKYQTVFGYSSEFLAAILCPNNSMCHQKFELIVDDLAFIGHPVCADPDGVWRFKPEEKRKNSSTSRGRNSRNRGGQESGSASPVTRSLSLEKEKRNNSSNTASPGPGPGPGTKCTWLHTFHFVLVLDLPDPSSSASGNVTKYFDVIYEQIGFVITAVLFQEQVMCNFVEEQCEPYSRFSDCALEASSIATAMKDLYESIKSSSMAYLSIHELPLELQLPPYLDNLLHPEEDVEQDTFNPGVDVEAGELWGPEMSFGWDLPALAPWKSLLLLDDLSGGGGGEDGEQDPFANLRSPYIALEDRPIVEGLMRFLETVTVTLSLADLASLLDWDLETQIFPTVRWLVQHRKAKIVDIISGSLKTVFTLPTKFKRPLSDLIVEFDKTFNDTHPNGQSSSVSPRPPPIPQIYTYNSYPSASQTSPNPHPLSPSVPIPSPAPTQTPPLSLPSILSSISTSSASQPAGVSNHFFSSVLKGRKDLIPVYHQVVLWMLKQDMLIVLHLRIRIVVTPDVKRVVREMREQGRRRRMSTNKVRGGGGNGNENGSRRTSMSSIGAEVNVRKRWRTKTKMKKTRGRVALRSNLDDGVYDEQSSGHGVSWLALSPKSAREYSRNGRRGGASSDSEGSKLSELILDDDDDEDEDQDQEGEDKRGEEEAVDDDDEDDQGRISESVGEKGDLGEEVEEEEEAGSENEPSMINDPGRATPLQRRWLNAMSQGKDPMIKRRFDLINQYFDGKRTDDEILYRAEITKRQLREVLHHYDEFLQTFLHPS